jgi:hypothetical protein
MILLKTVAQRKPFFRRIKQLFVTIICPPKLLKCLSIYLYIYMGDVVGFPHTCPADAARAAKSVRMRNTCAVQAHFPRKVSLHI